MVLRLAEQLELPEDGATQTYGFIARKGGGKTYAVSNNRLVARAGRRLTVHSWLRHGPVAS